MTKNNAEKVLNEIKRTQQEKQNKENEIRLLDHKLEQLQQELAKLV